MVASVLVAKAPTAKAPVAAKAPTAKDPVTKDPIGRGAVVKSAVGKGHSGSAPIVNATATTAAGKGLAREELAGKNPIAGETAGSGNGGGEFARREMAGGVAAAITPAVGRDRQQAVSSATREDPGRRERTAHGCDRARFLREDLEGLLDDPELPPNVETILEIAPDEFLEVQLASLDEVLTEFVLAAVEDLRDRLEEAPRVRDLAAYLLGRSQHPDVLCGPGSGVFGRVAAGGVHAAIERLLQIGALGVEGRSRRLRLMSASAWVTHAWGDERPRVLEALLGAPRRTPLYQLLADYRRQAAREAEVPAYRILTNRVLDTISRARPGTLRDLAAISGVGPQTLSNHGETILALVRSAPPDPITNDES